jgi:excisionase family DNA binding protein
MEKQPDLMPLLSLPEAANLLHVSPHMIRDMIRRKELLAFKVGHQWRISRSEVTKLIAHSF